MIATGDKLIQSVMAGLVPAIALREALCPSKRDHRDKPGDDKWKRHE
jgi:hypothetical protein